MILYKNCPVIKRGKVCFGDKRTKCGKRHDVPIKYCPNLAQGNTCKGKSECGFKHANAQLNEANWACRKGLRKGKRCKKPSCPFPHPQDF